ncbi:MAG: RpoL/Rpb11 RNA polymerase subunit family protein [Candidatus Micrarchaeia archaeon]
MEIKFIKKEKNYVEIEAFELDIGVLNAIKEIVLRDSDVEFSAVKRGHFLNEKHILTVRTKKKDAIELIKKAIEEFQKDLDKLEAQLK